MILIVPVPVCYVVQMELNEEKNSYNYDDVESVTIHNDWFVLFFHDYNSFDIIRDAMPLEKRVIGY